MSESIYSDRKDLSRNWSPIERLRLGKRIHKLHHEHEVSFPLVAKRFGISYSLVKKFYQEFLVSEQRIKDSSNKKNKTI